MKSSKIIIGVVVLIIAIVFFVYVFNARTSVAPTIQNDNSGSVSSSSEASSSVPGGNLTLGSDTKKSLGTFLVAYNGMTLYTYAPDTTNVSNCTGGCAEAWPPYTVTDATNLVAESPIGGKVGTITRADGSVQVTYNGHPLYFFARDAAADDTNGQGIGGVWFVVKP